MNRRNFLKTGAAGILVAAPAIVDSKGLFRGALGIVEPDSNELWMSENIGKLLRLEVERRNERVEILTEQPWEVKHRIDPKWVIDHTGCIYKRTSPEWIEGQHLPPEKNPRDWVVVSGNPMSKSLAYEVFRDKQS